ncbi:hypothetical protein [Candidatus Cyrtobacter comes]|nr:hypothetical protein [Candidatus Cyrtobacter comes]
MIYIRYKIASYARKWVGTPFSNGGRKNGIGCDCLGLFIGVAKRFHFRSLYEDKLISAFDTTAYHYLEDSKKLEHEINKHLIKIDAPRVGSIALISNQNISHIGIVADYINNKSLFSLIHASIERRLVIEHRLIFEERYAYFDFKELYYL